VSLFKGKSVRMPRHCLTMNLSKVSTMVEISAAEFACSYGEEQPKCSASTWRSDRVKNSHYRRLQKLSRHRRGVFGSRILLKRFG
jgi:hypothetical protein